MVSRFQRRGAPPEVTFFVFQDILTSMIGILIIITLALAVGAGESDEQGESAEGKRHELELSQKLDGTLAEVSRLKAQYELIGTAKGNAMPASALDGEEASLRRQIAIYGHSKEQRQQTVDKLGSRTISADLAADIMGMKALVEKSEGERDALKAKSEEGRKKSAETEGKVQAAMAALVAEQNRNHVLRLIPEVSGTTKEPVLVEADRAGFKITRFDTQGTVAQGTMANFDKGLGQLKASEQFVVFFIKPSAARDFELYVKKAKAAGFEVGYDLIGESMSLEFKSH